MSERSDNVVKTSAPTPGPWEADPEIGGVWGPDGEPIVTAGVNAVDDDDGSGWANACLIAAAPELKDALHHMHWCRDCGESSWEDCEGGRAALAAIAKAEGR